MYKNLLSWLTVLLVLPSCSGTSPAISVVCEENNVGNCIIKWETAPILKGQVKVYTSTSPETIPENSPIAITNISMETTVDGKRFVTARGWEDLSTILKVYEDMNLPVLANLFAGE